MTELAETSLPLPPNHYTGYSIQELIDTRYRVEQKKRELNKEEKQLNAELALIDELLFAYHADNPEVDRLKGEDATITFSEEEIFPFSDPEQKRSFARWAVENDVTHLMVFHINNAAAREYKRVFGDLPYCGTFEKRKISMRKA